METTHFLVYKQFTVLVHPYIRCILLHFILFCVCIWIRICICIWGERNTLRRTWKHDVHRDWQRYEPKIMRRKHLFWLLGLFGSFSALTNAVLASLESLSLLPSYYSTSIWATHKLRGIYQFSSMPCPDLNTELNTEKAKSATSNSASNQGLTNKSPLNRGGTKKKCS